MTSVTELTPLPDADFGAALVPVVIPGAGIAGEDAAAALSVQQLLAQLLLILSPNTVNSALTVSPNNALAIPNLPTLPVAGGVVVIFGSIAGVDTITGDSVVWTNVVLAVKRVSNGESCVPVGDTQVAPFEAEGTLQAIAAAAPPLLQAITTGPQIILRNNTTNNVRYAYNLQYGVMTLA